MVGNPHTIPVGCEPPPLRPPPSPNGAEGRPPTRHQGHNGRAKGKPARRKGDRFAVLNAFVDFTMRDLSRGEALVWLALFRDTKPDGIAQTSQADLARRAGVNVGTAKRAVAGLRRRGLLTVVFRGSLRRGPSAYRVHPLTSSPDKGAPAPPDMGAFRARNRVRRCAPSHKGPE
jgi:hypothetical protein